MLATIPPGAQLTSLTLDGAHVYWGTQGGPEGALYRTLKDGTGPVEKGPGLVGQRIAVDSGYIYNADDGYGYGVARTKKDLSGHPFNVANISSTSIDALAVGKHFLYAHSAVTQISDAVFASSAKALKCGGALVAPRPPGRTG